MDINLSKKITIVVLFAFLVNTFGPMPLAQAQDFSLPAPGVMVPLSPEFTPPILKGIKVHPDNPFRFDFIIDKGDGQLSYDALKDESSKLIKYFLASLTIPEKDLWVNLSPYEKDRIIPQSFGLTEMGRDLLAEDYMLKQITASLIYPENEVGKKFWKRIYEESKERFGTTNIPVNTFNKVWIVPEKAVVYENAKAGTAYVVESKLKVMLEQDYLSLQKHEGISSQVSQGKATNQLGSQIVREIVLPELAKEVNENKNFAQLRQVYNSLILATWYKKKIKDSILEQVYADKNKVAGVNIDDPQEKQRIYERYLQAFKKGVFNYIKEDIDPLSQHMIPRKYFSGGIVYDVSAAMASTQILPNSIKDQGDYAVIASQINGISSMSAVSQAMLSGLEAAIYGFSFNEQTQKLQELNEAFNRLVFDLKIDPNDIEVERSQRASRQGTFAKRIVLISKNGEDVDKLVRDNILDILRQQDVPFRYKTVRGFERQEYLIKKLKEEFGYLQTVFSQEGSPDRQKKLVHELAALKEVILAIERGEFDITKVNAQYLAASHITPHNIGNVGWVYETEGPDGADFYIKFNQEQWRTEGESLAYKVACVLGAHASGLKLIRSPEMFALRGLEGLGVQRNGISSMLVLQDSREYIPPLDQQYSGIEQALVFSELTDHRDVNLKLGYNSRKNKKNQYVLHDLDTFLQSDDIVKDRLGVSSPLEGYWDVFDQVNIDEVVKLVLEASSLNLDRFNEDIPDYQAGFLRLKDRQQHLKELLVKDLEIVLNMIVTPGDFNHTGLKFDEFVTQGLQKGWASKVSETEVVLLKNMDVIENDLKNAFPHDKVKRVIDILRLRSQRRELYSDKIRLLIEKLDWAMKTRFEYQDGTGDMAMTIHDPGMYAVIKKSQTKLNTRIIADGIVRTRFFNENKDLLKAKERKRWGSTVADLVIVGGGAAGLSAGIHAVDGGLKTVVIEAGYIAQSFSDAFMKSVHWMRSSAVTSSLVEYGVSSSRLMAEYSMDNAANLRKYRLRGQKARKMVSTMTGERFMGQPYGADRLDRNLVPVARNELYQHMLDVAAGIEDKGGFIVEQDPVIEIKKVSYQGNKVYQVMTKSGIIQYARKVIYAQGYVGENAEMEKVPKILTDLTNSQGDNYVPLFDLQEAQSIDQSVFKDKMPVITASVIGEPKVRAYIKDLPEGAQFAVIGNGESAAKSVVDLLNINGSLRIHYFVRDGITVHPSQLPTVYNQQPAISKGLRSKELRQQQPQVLKDHGTPITPQTYKDIKDLEKLKQVTIYEIGENFDSPRFRILTDRKDGKVIARIIDSSNGEQKAEIDGGFLSAIGYDHNKKNLNPFIQMLVEKGRVRRDQYGEIELDPRNGLTSAVDRDFYVTGAYIYHQGLLSDGGIPGYVFRGREIIRDILGKRKDIISEKQEVVGIFQELSHSFNFLEASRLVIVAVQPGQNVQKVKALYEGLGNIPIQAKLRLVLAAAQPGQNLKKVKKLLRYFMATQPSGGIELASRWVLAAAQPGQDAEKIEGLSKDLTSFEPDEDRRAQLVLASIYPGAGIEKVKQAYKSLKDSFSPDGASALVMAAVQFRQNAEKIKELYRDLEDLSSEETVQLITAAVQPGQDGGSVRRLYNEIIKTYPKEIAVQLVLPTVLYFEQGDEAMNTGQLVFSEGKGVRGTEANAAMSSEIELLEDSLIDKLKLAMDEDLDEEDADGNGESYRNHDFLYFKNEMDVQAYKEWLIKANDILAKDGDAGKENGQLFYEYCYASWLKMHDISTVKSTVPLNPTVNYFPSDSKYHGQLTLKVLNEDDLKLLDAWKEFGINNERMSGDSTERIIRKAMEKIYRDFNIGIVGVKDGKESLEGIVIVRDAGEALYLDSLAIAPWNRREGKNAQFRGLGSVLVAGSIEESFKRGYAGRIFAEVANNAKNIFAIFRSKFIELPLDDDLMDGINSKEAARAIAKQNKQQGNVKVINQLGSQAMTVNKGARGTENKASAAMKTSLAISGLEKKLLNYMGSDEDLKAFYRKHDLKNIRAKMSPQRYISWLKKANEFMSLQGRNSGDKCYFLLVSTWLMLNDSSKNIRSLNFNPTVAYLSSDQYPNKLTLRFLEKTDLNLLKQWRRFGVDTVTDRIIDRAEPGRLILGMVEEDMKGKKKLEGIAIITDAGEGLYINSLAIAPWNRIGSESPKLRGVGSVLVVGAIKESFNRGYRGRIFAEVSSVAENIFNTLGAEPLSDPESTHFIYSGINATQARRAIESQNRYRGNVIIVNELNLKPSDSAMKAGRTEANAAMRVDQPKGEGDRANVRESLLEDPVYRQWLATPNSKFFAYNPSGPGTLGVQIQIADDAFAAGLTDEALQRIIKIASHQDLTNAVRSGRSFRFQMPQGAYIRYNNRKLSEIRIKAVTYEGGPPLMRTYNGENSTVKQPTHILNVDREGMIGLSPRGPKPQGTEMLPVAIHEYHLMRQAFDSGIQTGYPIGTGVFTDPHMVFDGQAVGFVIIAQKPTSPKSITDGVSDIRLLLKSGTSPNKVADLRMAYQKFSKNMQEVLKVLRQLHHAGITHTHPHLDNFIRDTDGRMNVYDFANAKSIDEMNGEVEFTVRIFADFEASYLNSFEQMTRGLNGIQIALLLKLLDLPADYFYTVAESYFSIEDFKIMGQGDIKKGRERLKLAVNISNWTTGRIKLEMMLIFDEIGRHEYKRLKLGATVPNPAMATGADVKTGHTPPSTALRGGIDFTANTVNSAFRAKYNGNEIKFHIDPAMLKQLQSAPGFVPVVISIEPLRDLRGFLTGVR